MTKTLCKVITFEAGHKLINTVLSEKENKKVYGKCYDSKECIGHGHTYKLEVYIRGTVDTNGFIMNFSDLKRILEETIIKKYDHKFLNSIFVDNIPTTCENLVEVMGVDIHCGLVKYNKKFKKGVQLNKLVLWETPTSCVIKEYFR